jgi:hypothetical protein
MVYGFVETRPKLLIYESVHRGWPELDDSAYRYVEEDGEGCKSGNYAFG